MRYEVGGYVVLAEVGEKVHIPVPSQTVTVGRGTVERDLVTLDLPPLSWPTLCGLTGHLWLYQGAARRRGREVGFCKVCLGEATPGVLRRLRMRAGRVRRAARLSSQP